MNRERMVILYLACTLALLVATAVAPFDRLTWLTGKSSTEGVGTNT